MAEANTTTTALSTRSSGGRKLVLSFEKLAILAMIVQGLDNKEIGEKCYLSYRTIGNHVQDIFRRTGFTNRTQLAVWAVAKGVVPAPKFPEITVKARAVD